MDFLSVKNMNDSLFERAKHIREDGFEFWYARELQKILDYTEWRIFQKLLKRQK